MNTSLSFKRAKKLSLMKWGHIVKNEGKWERWMHPIPVLAKLQNQCGFCEKYLTFFKENSPFATCGKCPLQVNGMGCDGNQHPYRMWHSNSTKKNALAVLQLIRNTKNPDKKE